jgi:hypothetical protein
MKSPENGMLIGQLAAKQYLMNDDRPELGSMRELTKTSRKHTVPIPKFTGNCPHHMHFRRETRIYSVANPGIGIRSYFFMNQILLSYHFMQTAQ